MNYLINQQNQARRKTMAKKITNLIKIGIFCGILFLLIPYELQSAKINHISLLKPNQQLQILSEPIIIDEMLPESNWENYEFITGNGTIENPYLIDRIYSNIPQIIQIYYY